MANLFRRCQGPPVLGAAALVRAKAPRLADRSHVCGGGARALSAPVGMGL